MPQTSKTAWDAYVNQNITTNNNQEITGAIMNRALIDLSDSILWGDYTKAKNIAVTAVGTLVTFAQPMANLNYTLVCRVFDATGESVGFTIPTAQMTVNGFFILPAVDGQMDYLCLTTV